MQAADIGVVGETDRKQSPLDLFLIFAGANIVATTLQVGASLVPAFGLREALGFIAFGSVAGAALGIATARFVLNRQGAEDRGALQFQPVKNGWLVSYSIRTH